MKSTKLCTWLKSQKVFCRITAALVKYFIHFHKELRISSLCHMLVDFAVYLVVQCSEQPQFVLPHDSRKHEMFQVWKSFLQFEADSSQGNTVGENDISDHVPGNKHPSIERGRLCYILYLLIILALSSCLLTENIPVHIIPILSGHGSRLYWSHHLGRKYKYWELWQFWQCNR